VFLKSFEFIIAEEKNCCLLDIHFKGSFILISSVLVEAAER
jgi:hypothetical protein